MATFTVTNLLDSGAGSLRDAIFQANSNAGLDDIAFNNSLAGSTINLASGELVITDSININAFGDNQLTLDSGGLSRVFSIAGTSDRYLDVSLSGLKITAGQIVNRSGGAIYSNYGNLNIIDSIVSDNDGGLILGAGIYNDYGTLSITNSVFSSNNISGGAGYGGAIYNVYGKVSIDNSIFSRNSSVNGGGAIFNDSGIIDITNSSFSSNSGVYTASGGAIYNGVNGTVNLTSSNVSENGVSPTRGFGGGGIFNAGVLNINNSDISNNYAPVGGGIYNGGVANITDSTVSNNFLGGGIYNTGTLRIVNSDISGNTNISGEERNIINNGGAVFVPEGDTILGTAFWVAVLARIYVRQRRKRQKV